MAQQEIRLTKEQARRFLLKKQGLLGEYRFEGKDGVLDYVRQAGCVQFDPIDVCGKNAELVFQSRVKGFTKEMLSDLLYRDRALVDYFDKNLAIIPAENWPRYRRTREKFRQHSRGAAEVLAVREEVLREIRERGPLCSRDLALNQKVDWSWNPTRLGRAALESLYFWGELVVHHKERTVKFYDLAENCFDSALWQAPDPCPREEDWLKWRVKNRISAVGLLWNRPSDAWLGIDGFRAEQRERCFAGLLEREEIVPLRVEGISAPLYCLADDLHLERGSLESGGLEDDRERTEFLAPLDCMIWDRNLIRALFGFDYKWEIYTPVEQRKYGYYVLPVLHGTRFAGRVEAVRDSRAGRLELKHFWPEPGPRPEPGVKATKKLRRAVAACARRFARFNGCKDLVLPEGWD